MRLHVLTGCSELLRPRILAPEESASLIGPRVKTVTASWLSPECGSYYHTFLEDGPEDCRTKVVALAVKDEFGIRYEPLLVLPDLLDETAAESPSPPIATERRSQLTILSEIWHHGRDYLQQLRLYALALPANADPEGAWAVPAGIVSSEVRDRIEKFRTYKKAEKCFDAVETQVIEATPGLPSFGVLYNNSLCSQFTLRLSPCLREEGWASDVEILSNAIVNILEDWKKKGIFPTMPLRAKDLDAMTKLIYAKLL